jgi:membrane protein implicated in regulation of membrane protease activity
MWLFDVLEIDAPSTLEVIFIACAVFGSAFFIIMMTLMLLGGIVGGAIDTVFDADFTLDTDLSFELFTLQGLSAAIMMFGLVGMFAIKSTDTEVIAVFAGGIAAIASLYAMKVMMQGIYALQTDGTMHTSEAVGVRGTVYSRIKPGETGEVQVPVKGGLRTLAARAKDKDLLIPTGTFIRVVDSIGSTLIVEELKDVSSQVEEEQKKEEE